MISVLVVTSKLSILKLSCYELGFEGVSIMLHRNKLHTVSSLFYIPLFYTVKSQSIIFMVMAFL